MKQSETAVSNKIRLRAAELGIYLWRNNVGATYTQDGNFLRYGLANDSSAVNKILKSSDLIGIKPIIITPDMTGKLIGQFYCREVKHGGWRYTGTDREKAQLNWIDLINRLGGDAAFTTGEEL